MAGKMDKTTIIASAVVGSLGLLSAILGFSAEVTKITATDVLVGARGECLYPQNPAAELGITVSAVGGCCGCCMSGRSIPSETKRIIGVVCAVMSWLVTTDITAGTDSGIAWFLFGVGAVVNIEGKRATMPDCYVVKRGIFAGAAVLALAATAFGITSYVMLRTQADEAPAKKPPLAGVAMGQPQFLPPQASHV
uniref:Transmembrane protein n=1 Tax=Oryza barthii TaxID=65489 RepID=A0A0D3G817_9ORYZ